MLDSSFNYFWRESVDYSKHLLDVNEQLDKALSYLEYSYNKVTNLPDDPTKLDQETLETWESFTARFSRVADIFMAKYLRTKALIDDPAFRGTMRDILNYAEKVNLIDDAETWMTIRSLRNISAHEYTVEDLRDFFKQLKTYTPKLLSLKSMLQEK